MQSVRCNADEETASENSALMGCLESLECLSNLLNDASDDLVVKEEFLDDYFACEDNKYNNNAAQSHESLDPLRAGQTTVYEACAESDKTPCRSTGEISHFESVFIEQAFFTTDEETAAAAAAPVQPKPVAVKSEQLEDASYNCRSPGFDFGSDQNLGVKVESPAEVANEPYRKVLSDKINRFQCGTCHRRFICRENLLAHTANVHKIATMCICQVCNEVLANQRDLNDHVSQNHWRSCGFTCDFCKKGFKLKRELRSHIDETHRVSKNHCALCSKNFASVRNLNRHVKFVHQKLKDFFCIFCCKRFSRKYDLHAHIRRIHEGFKKFVCYVCEKKFSKRIYLECHLKKIHNART